MSDNLWLFLEDFGIVVTRTLYEAYKHLLLSNSNINTYILKAEQL